MPIDQGTDFVPDLLTTPLWHFSFSQKKSCWPRNRTGRAGPGPFRLANQNSGPTPFKLPAAKAAARPDYGPCTVAESVPDAQRYRYRIDDGAILRAAPMSVRSLLQ